MKNIIESLVKVLYRHETWDENGVTNDESLDAMAEAASVLKGATKEEMLSLQQTLSELSKSSTNLDFSSYCEEFIDLYIRDYDENW